MKHCPQEILFFRQAFNYNRNEHLCSPLFYKIRVCFYLPANRNDSLMFHICKRGLSAPNAAKAYVTEIGYILLKTEISTL